VALLGTILTVLLWLCCFLIVAVVLLQTGKGGGLAGVFGGGAGPDSLLGTRATSFLVKVTIVLCLMFLVLVIVLNRMSRQAVNKNKYETPAPVAAPLGYEETAPEGQDEQPAAQPAAEEQTPAEENAD
jgi:preprotein translocase subunit SecG